MKSASLREHAEDLAKNTLTPDLPALGSGLPALDAGWEYRTFRTPGGIGGDPREFIRAVVETTE